jgi:hypothetical protein
MIHGESLSRWLAACALLAAAMETPAHAANVQVSGLADVNFGMINSLSDQSNNQNVSVCSYQDSLQGWLAALPYSVVATGSGKNSAFTLSSGAGTLAYDVQWADSPNRTTGTMLQAGVTSGNFDNAASLLACLRPPENASLIVTIRAAQLTSATAGNYSGTLRITIVPD